MIDPQSIKDVVQLRPGTPGDLAFVYARWLRDLRHADGGPLPDDLWFPAHRGLINRVLADPKVELHILHPVDVPTEILGFIVAEPHEVLHWIYLKPKFRGRGLALMLLQAAHAEHALASWTTPDAKARLQNPRRPRQLRPRYATL